MDKRIKTPTVLQIETVECGAAALAIILAYYGRFVPLEELRVECGISRDGSKASNIVKAARKYGLKAQGFKKEHIDDLLNLPMPQILFWKFNHFIVFEGIKKKQVYINDPASGPRRVSFDEFDKSFTGVTLTFEKTADFEKGGAPKSMLTGLKKRFDGCNTALGFITLIGLCLVIPGVILPAFIKIFIDDILIGGMSGRIFQFVTGMILAAALQASLSWLQSYYLLRMGAKIAVVQSSRFFRHILKLPMEFFAQRFGGELVSRVALNDMVAQLLSGELAQNVINSITVIFFLIIMFHYSIILTFAAIAVLSVNILILRYISRKRKDISAKSIIEESRLTGVSMNGLQSIETIKSTGRESDFFTKWAGYYAKVINAFQELSIIQQPLMALPGLLNTINISIILMIGGWQIINGNLSIGSLLAFQFLMQNFSAPFIQIINMLGNIQELEGNMNRLDDVFNYKISGSENTADNSDNVELKLQNVKLSGALEINNITFGYSRLEPPLIKNFSLTLNPGRRVAIVGKSGSGKTTISKLISGLYKPWSGEILFDGQPLEKIENTLFTNSISVVDQDIFLFEGSVKDNLTIWDNTIPFENIINAAKDANIHDDIAGRRLAYESLIEERGANFSGGQRQRLEIARALVNNPSLLILDEATGALDAVTEKKIDDNMRRRGCSCLIIAHRLSSIRDADEIIVMDNGEIIERGSHKELVNRNGVYSELIKE